MKPILFSLTMAFLDTLLNVFLAIAVDNLANAQELTAAEEEQDEQVSSTTNTGFEKENIMIVMITLIQVIKFCLI